MALVSLTCVNIRAFERGRFFGLRCAAISTITNFGAGMTGADQSHEETKRLAPIGAAKLERVIRRYLRDRQGQ